MPITAEPPRPSGSQSGTRRPLRRDVLCEGLNAAGWKVEKPKATMFLWAEIPEQFRHLGSMEFSKKRLGYIRHGGKVPVELEVSEECETCKGSGGAPGATMKSCPECSGRGTISSALWSEASSSSPGRRRAAAGAQERTGAHGSGPRRAARKIADSRLTPSPHDRLPASTPPAR